MNVSFKGKKVLITGAGRGIGRDLAKTLAKDGAVVFALSKNADNLSSLKKECPSVHTIVCDLADWKGTEKALADLEPMDYLVNNAGVAIRQNLLEATEEVTDLILNVNVKSYINVTKLVTKKMIDAGIKGAVVHVSSVGGIRCNADLMVYNTSKAAVEMLTKCMAKGLAQHGIRVNSVNPTVISQITFILNLVVMTDMGTDLWSEVQEEFRKKLPIQDFPTTEHCTNAILYLLSDLSERTTGNYIAVDSGELLL